MNNKRAHHLQERVTASLSVMKKGVTFQREPKKWVLMDDGTHKNAYYASNYGEKSRREPEEFEQEKLDNGEPKYYFRGTSITCFDELVDIM